jgi:uncharacterized DUF497 family protein
MRHEWDEAKRLFNTQKRRIDLVAIENEEASYFKQIAD